MAKTQFDNITVLNARFIYKTNFRGEPDDFNKQGDRLFNVVLEGEALEKALACGLRVKYSKPKDDSEPEAFVKVKVGFKYRPPHIELINSRCKRYLTEETVGLLDSCRLDHIDLVLRPNEWTNPMGETGVNAYLEELYAVMHESSLAAKYADIPEAGELGD